MHLLPLLFVVYIKCHVSNRKNKFLNFSCCLVSWSDLSKWVFSATGTISTLWSHTCFKSFVLLTRQRQRRVWCPFTRFTILLFVISANIVRFFAKILCSQLLMWKTLTWVELWKLTEFETRDTWNISFCVRWSEGSDLMVQSAAKEHK